MITRQSFYTSSGGELPDDLISQLGLLIATPLGTVVLDREFGIDMTCLDMPPPVAQSLLAAELAVKIPKYIPQLQLSQVKLTDAAMDGELYLTVVVDYA